MPCLEPNPSPCNATAAVERAMRRAMKGRGRTLGAINVYLVGREILQAARILQPDYYPLDWGDYYFTLEDGSVFVVQASGWFAAGKRLFVLGPRKGTSERLSNDEMGEYRDLAEAKWGKYIPGTLFSAPRFIPGTDRKSLPLYDYELGVPREVGWVDEIGDHRYTVPTKAST
jgi:hypothetical protein